MFQIAMPEVSTVLVAAVIAPLCIPIALGVLSMLFARIK